MKHWWCMGCEAEVRLGKHGQCEVCGSEAVDLATATEEVSRSSSVRKLERERARS
jgi:rRNA maturation endonuclease Nob1